MILTVHPIKRYCETHGLKQRAFAEKADLSEGFVSQLIRGHEKCGRGAALQIVGAADGEITLEELLTWAPPKRRRRRRSSRLEGTDAVPAA